MAIAGALGNTLGAPMATLGVAWATFGDFGVPRGNMVQNAWFLEASGGAMGPQGSPGLRAPGEGRCHFWAWGGLQRGEQSPIGNRQLACHHWWIVLSDMNSDWWIVVAGMGLRIVDGSWWYGDCGLEMENCAPTAVVPAKGPRIEATEGGIVTVLGLSRDPELRAPREAL